MSFTERLALKLLRLKFHVLSTLSPRTAAEAAFTLFCTPRHRNTKELPPVFGGAEVLRFRFRDYDIVGYRWNRGATKTVLILHGFESSIVNFAQYVEPLVARGFCVLGLDAPAHGRSSGTQVNVLLYKEFIEQVQKDYGPIDAYMAHSLGGLALSVALEGQPGVERARIALIAPATETRTAIDGYFDFLKMPASLRAPFDRLIQERSGHPPEWFSVARVLQELPAQVLWVHDEDDDMTPVADAAPVRKAARPNIRFYITKGLGHRRVYRDADVQERVVQFLTGE